MESVRKTNFFYMQSTTTKPSYKQRDLKFLRKKNFTNKFILPMLFFEIQSPLHKQYQRAFYCGNDVARDSYFDSDANNVHSQLVSKRCKTRFCLNCSIKQSIDYYNGYFDTISSWTEKKFLTLTVVSVKDFQLRDSFTAIQKTIAKINNTVNKRRKRNNETPLKFIVRFECTYSAKRNDYHPHVHAICENINDAQELLEEWLLRFPSADRQAQNIRDCDDAFARELFKYFTKVITDETTVNQDSKVIYAESLDTIFQAIRNKRTLIAYGFKKSKKSKTDYKTFLAELEKTATKVVETFRYIHDEKNYINMETGEPFVPEYSGESLDKIKVQKYNPKPIYTLPIKPVNSVLKRKAREHDTMLV